MLDQDFIHFARIPETVSTIDGTARIVAAVAIPAARGASPAHLVVFPTNPDDLQPERFTTAVLVHDEDDQVSRLADLAPGLTYGDALNDMWHRMSGLVDRQQRAERDAAKAARVSAQWERDTAPKPGGRRTWRGRTEGRAAGTI